MTTFYLDYEGGSDAADGTTFANRWKTITSGATAARIAPGDTIRVMASPDQTSLGITGVWTDVPAGGLAATKSITSSTNATPIVVTITTHGYSNGDTIVITGHTTNTFANGTWEIANKTDNTFELVGSTGNGTGGATGTARLRNNTRVTLASALTKNINNGNRGNVTDPRIVWTASANVTTSHSTTDFKDGDVSDSIVVDAAFTTGLAAYHTLPASTDYSGYRQVSFWIKQTAGTLGAASALSITLCSDTVGATAVDAMNIPAFGALNQWMPFTIDKGATLGAAIQSVAFYVNTDNGAQTFLISDIIAVKDSTSADSLSLTSLIGKNTAGETFYGIQSINGTRVMLDNGVNITPNSASLRGYSRTTETITTYKRETIKTVMVAAVGTDVQIVQDSGTIGSLISFEGGYNRTDMSTQTGETWFDGQNGLGDGIVLSGKSFVLLNKISGVRYGSSAINTASTSSNITITNGHYNNNTTNGINAIFTHNSTFTNIIINNNASSGIAVDTSNNNTITTVTGNNNTGSNINIACTGSIFIDIISYNSGTSGVAFSHGANNILINPIIKNNSSAAFEFVNDSTNNIIFGGSSTGNSSGIISPLPKNNYFRGFTINETVEFNTPTNYANAYVYSEKHDGTLHNDKVFVDGGLISKVTDQLHGSSNYSWKFQPTSAIRRSVYPIDLPIMQIACDANLQVTVNGWFRASHANMLGLLVCKGKQVSGVDNDVTDTMTVAADTWEQLTIQFTPTEKGVVEILARFYTTDGVTTYDGWYSDPSVSQA